MQFTKLSVVPLLLMFLIVGCQPAKKPAPQPQPLTEPPPPTENQSNMESNPEPAPMPEPAPEPTVRRHVRSTGTPHLGSLSALYNAKAGTLTVTLYDRILFALGSTKLKPSAHATLDHIATAIRHQYPGHRIYVDGHTDSSPIKSGRWVNNHQLAFERALAVADYLMAHGIHEREVVIRSYGPNNPKRTADLSRRVEIVVQVR